MSIIQSEIKWYKAITMNDTGANGGRMSSVVSVDGVKNAIMPDIQQSERTSGSTKYRKAFIKVDNTEGAEAGLALQESKVFVEDFTVGDDAIVIFPGTPDDIQSELTGSERAYGNGSLDSSVIAGATVISVLTEGAALDIFQDGDLVRVSDKTDVDDNTGSEEYVNIVASSISYVGDVATFTVTPALASSYTAASTRVASVITSFGDVQALASAAVVVQGSGTFDDTNYPIVVPNTSGIDQDWTLTFTDATTFTISGNTIGPVGGGTVGTGASPNNPDYSNPYFTIDSAAFGGSFVATDSIVFSTVSASMPLWYKRVVPPGANAVSVNGPTIACDGSSI